MDTSTKPCVVLVAPPDEPEVYSWVHDHLPPNYELTHVSTGKEALERLETSPVDIFLTEETLPDMTGDELCQELLRHKDYDQTPIIMMTNDDDPSHISSSLDAGATILLHKPLKIFDLYHALLVASRFKESQYETIHLISKLKKISQKDPLTDLYNRHVLTEQGIKEISKARRTQSALSLLMIDIDFFKRVNDTYGHIAGDQVLVSFSELLADNLRDYDLIFRYGGEEFMVILPYTSTEHACSVAEKLRRCVEETAFLTTKGKLHITISIGVAGYSPHLTTIEQFIQEADQALFLAKRAGRNQIALAEEPTENETP